MQITVRVAGTSAIKVNAARAALDFLCRAHDTKGQGGIDSGVPEQPWNDELILRGALNRAKGVRSFRGAHGIYGAAAENGIDADGTREDYAYCVVITPSGHVVVKKTRGVVVPQELIDLSRASGWTITCGKLEAERTPGCDHANPHPIWADDVSVQREALLTEAFIEAFTEAFALEEGSRTVPSSYPVILGGVACNLPIKNVGSGAHIAYLHLGQQPEALTQALAAQLHKLVPDGTGVIVTPDGKALGLYEEIVRLTGLPGVVCPKQWTPEMGDSFLCVSAVSITTPSQHDFHLSEAGKALVQGENVVVVDDIVSRGGTKDAISALMTAAEAASVTFIAIGTEGTRRDDVLAPYHFPVFVKKAAA